MRFGGIAAVIALVGALTLTACAPAGDSGSVPAPGSELTPGPGAEPGAGRGAQAGGGSGSQSQGAAPKGAPPDQQEAPIERSPVTWEIVHIASGMKTPGGPLHLAPPYRFELIFSGPVDRPSVEAALRSNAGDGAVQAVKWADDTRLTVEMAAPAEGGQSMAAVDPTGGRDREGRLLKRPDHQFNLAAFAFWPAEPTRLIRLDPRTGEAAVIADHGQPFQTVSASPDGRRHLLRRHVLTPGQSVGITGSAYLFDVESKAVAPLGVGHLFWHQWSGDRGLLVCGGSVVWVPPEAGDVGSGAPGPGGADSGPPDSEAATPPERVGRLLYRPEPGESVAGAALSPDGRYIAVFAGKWGEPYALHLFDREGTLIRTLPGAAGVTQGPSGLTSVPAAWAPDGSLLAYGDGGVRREEGQPMRIWLVAPEGGEPRLLAESAPEMVTWSPDGDHLFLPGVGVVDPEGSLLLTAPEGPAAWSPDGRLLFLRGTVYDTATWTVRWEAPAEGPAYWAPDSQSLAITGQGVGEGRGGGLYRADGRLIAAGYTSWVRPLFSPDGAQVYLPHPDRVVEVATGSVLALKVSEPPIQGLGEYRPVGFAADGGLLLALGDDWDQ